MNQDLKNYLQIIVGVVLVVQFMGCVFADRDRHGYPRYYEHVGEPSLDIRVHN